MTQSGSLVDWLSKLGVSKELNNNDILSGITVNSTLKKIVPNYTLTLSSNHTASTRITNWNSVINQLQKVGIKVGQQQKSKILNGDDKIVYNILYELKDHYDKSREEVQVDLTKIDSRGDPKAAKSLLELLILVIIKHYGFSVKEAVALLSNDSKYLAHILAKGFKDNPKPVQNMLNELLKLLPQINSFCKNKQNQTFFLKSIKPALISKFLSISEVSLQLVTEFTKNIHQRLDVIKTQLMTTFVLSLRRHPCQLGLLVHSMTEILGHNKNLLPFIMAVSHPNQQYLFMVQFLNQAEKNGTVSEIFQMFKFADFVEQTIECLRDSQLFINAATFMIKIVQCNYQNFTNQQLLRIVDNLSMLSLAKRSSVIIYANLLFAFLHTFGKRKNPIAPQFFKLAVDKYRGTINEDESHNFLFNFLNITEIFPSIPTASIVEAILFRYETSTCYIGQLQLQIIENAMGFMDEKGALRVYNIITKLFVEEVGNPEAISNIIETLIRRFDSKIIFDLNVKFMKVCLAIYYANIRKLNYSKSLVEGTVKLDYSNAFYKAKNIEIEKLLTSMISVQDQSLNTAIEPLICYTFIQSQLKNKEEAQGLKKIMLLLGDQEELRKLYQADAKLLLEQARNEGRKKVDIRVRQPQGKSRVNSDASLLNKKKDYLLHHPPKVALDAKKGLEKYTKAFKQKMVKLSLEEERRLQQEQKQEQLRKKFTLKILQKGIKITKDVQVNCIYEFGTKQKQQQRDSAIDFSHLPFYDPQLEEDRDVKAIQYLTKKYSKLLKVYYHNYGGKLRPNTLKLFEDVSHNGYMMQSANVWKLLRDNDLDLFITVKQIQHTVQKINTHLKKDYQDYSMLDFQVFQNFLIQASFIMFSRPPKDLRAKPVSDMFQEMINKFKEHARTNKIDEKLFDEPDNYRPDKVEEIKAINENLAQNPDYILPEGYKKVTVKKFVFDYQVKVDQSIGVSEYHQDVLEVIDQIFSQHLGFHVIEPYSSTIVEATARPTLYQSSSSIDFTMKQRSFSSAMPKISRVKETVKEGQEGEEAEGSRSGNQLNESRTPGYTSKIQNKYLKDKKEREEQNQRKLQEEQKRRQQRDKELKALLQKHKEKQQQSEQEKAEKKIQQKRRKEEEKRKRQKYQQDLKKKVEQFSKKREEEKAQEEQERKKRKEQEIKNYQKLKEDIKRKKKMVNDHKEEKQREEEERRQKQRDEQKEKQQQKKAREEERREKEKVLIEEFKLKRQKQEEEKQRKKAEEEEENEGRSRVKAKSMKSSNVKKTQVESSKVKEKQPIPEVKVEQL